MDRKDRFLAVFGDGVLRLADGWSGLYMGPENDLISVTDTAKNTACMVRFFNNA